MHDELTRWFEENQRPLPWRISHPPYDPYHVWISEIMLQQTQVETMLPYFEKFIGRFPDVASLAEGSETDVLSLWAGLGYYSRARNLMAAAQRMVKEHHGQIPGDYDQLRALPGVGQYTAGAILSIAFNKPYPVVDGNVRRVLSRVHGWKEEQPKRIWDAAERLVQQATPRLVNQAVMELGATVCSFRSPRCLVCPLQSVCVAFRTGLQGEIPPRKARPETVRVNLFAVVQQKSGRYLMRESKGFWEFPMFPGLPEGRLDRAGSCRHTVTHHRLEVTVYRGELEETGMFSWKRFDSVPVSSLTRKIQAVAMGDRGK
jgi:A/G-specific adenine glycosylase